MVFPLSFFCVNIILIQIFFFVVSVKFYSYYLCFRTWKPQIKATPSENLFFLSFKTVIASMEQLPRKSGAYILQNIMVVGGGGIAAGGKKLGNEGARKKRGGGGKG